MKCTVCEKENSYIYTFIGAICIKCNDKTDKMAEEKLKDWKLPRFEGK
jgi:hypothetical protein